MIRLPRLVSAVAGLMLWIGLALPVAAQAQLGGVARMDPVQSWVQDRGDDGISVQIYLSQGVPYRIFTLDEPRRLVLEFNALDFSGFDLRRFDQSIHVTGLRYGQMQDGWSRMVFDLAIPQRVERAGMAIAPVDQTALLTVTLRATTASEYAQNAGPPNRQAVAGLPPPTVTRTERDPNAPFVVAIDPGHGGLDPGAQVGDANEADLMLSLARMLRDAFRRNDDVEVIMTRDADVFVPLEQRIQIAHEAAADVFISLHADIVTEGNASGATVYTLSQKATDAASEKLAERHDRAEILAGVDLRGTDDEVTGILMELARGETQPRSVALAKVLVAEFDQSLDHVNGRPHRGADFSVLKAADIPSVLIEAGFMSSSKDLKNLKNAEWRQSFADAIVRAVLQWQTQDAAAAALRRQ